ncbi:MAG: CehA/McbA family metallohydrolase [Clostridia bacterium]|nr:CehA/McbA family metallohydrolase [Clostridia bacterium]
MKKILLPENMPYYRANLHCHSTVSDGRKTPEELKAFYMSRGYQVIAYTDHEKMVCHNDLTDEHFVALNGYEAGFNESEGDDWTRKKVCHLCLVAMDPDRTAPVAESAPRIYSGEAISDFMQRAAEEGFYVTYNHPVWSLESYPQYSGYHGMHAMEIVNFACLIEGFDDDNGHCYEDFLRMGQRLFCIATDDNHNAIPDDSPACDSFGGYTMIAAESLDYRAVTDGLKQGRFYASTGTATHVGPVIKSLVYEDGVVTITTSEVREIAYIPDSRCCALVHAKDGETINAASFRVKEGNRWFRLVVRDREGYKAYTNAYFPDDFLETES